LKIHLLEHDAVELSPTNITIWADKNGHTISRTPLYKLEEPPSIQDIDWLMIMGGSPHAWDEDIHPWLADEKKYITQGIECNKIILGICLGAQLLAEILGARIYPNKKREIGWHDVVLTPEGKNSFLFQHVPETFVSFHWHSDHFSLPRGCTRLAYTTPTPHQAFAMKGRTVVGLQFHPEYSLEMVRHSSLKHGDEWVKGPFVAGKEKILEQSDQVPDTYWLMEMLLDNMVREFDI